MVAFCHYLSVKFACGTSYSDFRGTGKVYWRMNLGSDDARGLCTEACKNDAARIWNRPRVHYLRVAETQKVQKPKEMIVIE